jgi:hypothetical protein
MQCTVHMTYAAKTIPNPSRMSPSSIDACLCVSRAFKQVHSTSEYAQHTALALFLF